MKLRTKKQKSHSSAERDILIHDGMLAFVSQELAHSTCMLFPSVSPQEITRRWKTANMNLKCARYPVSKDVSLPLWHAIQSPKTCHCPLGTLSSLQRRVTAPWARCPVSKDVSLPLGHAIQSPETCHCPLGTLSSLQRRVTAPWARSPVSRDVSLPLGHAVQSLNTCSCPLMVAMDHFQRIFMSWGHKGHPVRERGLWVCRLRCWQQNLYTLSPFLRTLASLSILWPAVTWFISNGPKAKRGDCSEYKL